MTMNGLREDCLRLGGWRRLLACLTLLACFSLADAATTASASYFRNYAEFEKALGKAKARLEQCKSKHAEYEKLVKIMDENPDSFTLRQFRDSKEALRVWGDCVKQALRDLEFIRKNMPPQPTSEGPGEKGDEEEPNRPAAGPDPGDWTPREYDQANEDLGGSSPAFNEAAEDHEQETQRFRYYDEPK